MRETPTPGRAVDASPRARERPGMAAKAQGASDAAPEPRGKAPKPSASAKRAKEDARKRAGKRAKAATARDDGATTAREASGVRGYWQAPEEQALKRAVRKHGIGAWEKMRNDPEFAALRCARDASERTNERTTRANERANERRGTSDGMGRERARGASSGRGNDADEARGRRGD